MGVTRVTSAPSGYAQRLTKISKPKVYLCNCWGFNALLRGFVFRMGGCANGWRWGREEGGEGCLLCGPEGSRVPSCGRRGEGMREEGFS